MKKLLTVLLAAALVIGLAACGQKPAEETSGKTTVTIWHTYTEGQKEYLEKAIADFNASQDQYEVVAESQPYDGFTDKVYQAVNAGNGPDMIIHYASEAAKYVADDKLVDLGAYLSADTIALMSESTKAEATSFADGKMHILPIVSSGPILFYNQELYDELGLKAPTTWEELLNNCRVVKEKYPDKFGFAFDSEVDGAQTLIMQTGNTLFDASTNEILFNTPEVAAQMQMYKDAVQEGLFTNAKTGNYFSEDFNAGLIAAYIGSAAGAPYLQIPYGMGPVPQGGAVEWVPAWNRGIIVFNYGDENRAKAAAAFTDYFATPEVNAGWCVACNYPATFPATMETQTYKDFVANNESFTYLNAEHAGAFPAVTAQAYIRTALQTLMSSVAGGADVQESLDAAVTYIQEELANE
ncbi:MAG: extracellular solute-binding protein [Erysipelotrichaceae bacterium]|nr:extracellular solute-binding protein [Erysipelotrichaceae bacterium]